ncbi:hypothetical protein N24_2853 [Corynebacterium suranareeae]|uniref:Uncharacterized protein n=1 Tax=Corynebacterium suranareeae TaxID=2506452 RepID=A0A169S408_9CORY|nr:hypothetical protein [Corynebacterium suranareeae]BAU97115.1 hypothetical protein N24_2853 [Corynebacterium suranareeae]
MIVKKRLSTALMALSSVSFLVLQGCSSTETEEAPESSSESSPATSSEPEAAPETTVTQVPEPTTLDYIHIDPATYDTGVTDQETVVFTTGDGTTAHCFFEATLGQYNFQIRMFTVDETAGSCTLSAQDNQQVSITTDDTVQSNFAELGSLESELPQAHATLDVGEMVHLGHMGCWAPTASEFSCLDFDSSQAFTIDAQGFHEIDVDEATRQLTNSQDQVQALSMVTTFEFDDATSLTCVSKIAGGQFMCHNSGPAGWESTQSQGPANTISWNLDAADGEFEGAHPTNPGINIYESQQKFGPGSYRLANGVSAEFDGNTLNITTVQGNQFWATTQAFGAGTG